MGVLFGGRMMPKKHFFCPFSSVFIEYSLNSSGEMDQPGQCLTPVAASRVLEQWEQAWLVIAGWLDLTCRFLCQSYEC